MLQIFLPATNQDFLVSDERVLFDSRYHSAMVLRPALEWMAILTLLVLIQIDSPVTRGFLAMLAAIAALAAVASMVKRLRWNQLTWIVVGAVAGLMLVAFRPSPQTIVALIAIGFGFRFGLAWLRWRFYRRLVVTDRRIISVDGIIGSEVATMPLFRITDAKLSHSAVGELLGYGEFRIESAGQDQALSRINFLTDASAFQRLIIRLSTTPKTDIVAPNLADEDPPDWML